MDSLRLFASLLILIHHVEQFKLWSNLPNLYGDYWIKEIGRLGVSVFFVLSGFVVTNSFLKSLKKNKNISIKEYMQKRYSKLMPLYYLVLFLSLLVIPLFNKMVGVNLGYTKITVFNLLFYLLFFPDLLFIFGKPLLGISQSWFLGVQEHLYIFWLFILKKLRKISLKTVIFIIAGKLVLLNSFYLLYSFINSDLISKIITGFIFVDFESVIIGSFGGYMLFSSRQIKSKKIIFFLGLAYLILSTVFNFAGLVKTEIIRYNFQIILSTIRAFSLLSVIFYISFNEKLFPFNLSLFRRLGNYSYGIYMFHPFVSVFLINYLKLNKSLLENYFFIYSSVILLTAGVSIVYFRYVESRLVK
ncbi:acyltransferase [Candidatus Roizmanbacteria bacterium]|nr:acyltransferase [Candidatus Roizmanbacteria bacterium]